MEERHLKWSGSETGPNHEGNYRLELVFENDDSAPLPLTCLPGQNALYLHADTLIPGPPLLQAEADPNVAFEIPQDTIESSEGLLFLRNQGLALPESLAGKIVTVPLQSFLYIDLAESSDRVSVPRSLDVSIVSASRDKNHWFVLTDQDWVPSEN